MNVDTLVKTTLEKLGCPVERLKYDGKAKTFITYQIVVGQDTHFSDDESGAEEFIPAWIISRLCGTQSEH